MNLSAVNKTVTLVGRLFDPHHATEAYLPQVSDKPVFPGAPAPYFPRVTPEEAGVSSRAVAKLLNELYDDPTLNMHSLLLSRNGKVFCEASFGAQDTVTWKYTFSGCKSVVSLAVGILMGQGKLSPEDKLVDLFSDRLGPVSRLRLSPITVRDLLTMRSGIVFNEAEAMTDEDWIKCYLNSAVTGEIGKTFNYNSMNTYMLSAILTRKSGMSLCAFLDRYLFGPMDIRTYYWETCPRGIEKGGWGLYILPEDMLKLSTLILSGGIWNGQQLVPARYLHTATTAQTETPASCGNYDYGYQMWIGKNVPSFLFNGMLGQNTFGYPETGIAAASNAGNSELFQQSSVYGILDRYLGLPGNAVWETDAPLPPDEEGLRLLEDALARLRGLPVPKRETQPPELPAAEQTPHGERSAFQKFFDAFFASFRRNNAPTPVSAPEMPAPPVRRVLPDRASLLLDRVFTPAGDEPTASVGLLPVVLQVMQYNYTKGLQSLSFSKRETEEGEQLVLTYRETDNVLIFPIAVNGEPAPRTQLYFRGEPFLIAASGRFTHDEDGNPVFCLRCDFPETPCSRVIKLFFFRDGTVILRQSEIPGAPLVLQAVIDGKEGIEAQPVIGAALEKIDNDYLAYRICRTFAPELRMCIDTHPALTAGTSVNSAAAGGTAGGAL